MQVAYLGPRGSFTHQVAQQAFPTADLQAFETITEVIKAYETGEVTYSVIPVENSIEGSVHETIDYLSFIRRRFMRLQRLFNRLPNNC